MNRTLGSSDISDFEAQNGQFQIEVVQLSEFIDNTNNRESFTEWCNCNRIADE